MGGQLYMITQQFKNRLLTSSFTIAILILSVYYSQTPIFYPFFVLINVGIVCFALAEYYNLAKKKDLSPFTFIGISASAIYLLALSFCLRHGISESYSSLVLLFFMVLLFITAFQFPNSALNNIAVTLFAIGYLTLPLSCVLRINDFFIIQDTGDGRLWLAYTLIVSKITDIGAYICGKSFGKTKLAPSISPKKTIAGSIGGTLLALFFSISFALLVSKEGLFYMTVSQSIWIGLIVSLLAQLGDLSESLLKRDAGVQDSNKIPGLGGILDMVDSLIFTLPFIYLLLCFNLNSRNFGFF